MSNSGTGDGQRQPDGYDNSSPSPPSQEKLQSPCSPAPSGIPQSDSGICLTPQSLTVATSPQQQKHGGGDFSGQENNNTLASSQEAGGPATALNPQDLENMLPPELPPEGKVALHPPPDEVIASQQNQAVLKDQKGSEIPGQPSVPKIFAVGVSPGSSTHSLHSSSSGPTQTASNRLKSGNIPSSDSRSPTPDQPRLTRSPRHAKSNTNSSSSPDNFKYQTKYLVLQYLQQATSEQHLHLSQNSLSTTSESDARFKSRTQMLRRQWQDSRSHSSPTTPRPKSKPRSLAKTKGTRSSPNLKDANFFKDLPEEERAKRRGSTPRKPAVNRRSPKPTRQSPVQRVAQADLIRSVSQNTENSEHGTYDSDADDELDNSFDSSQQGSITSLSFRNKLSKFHAQLHRSRLPTVHSESEGLADVVPFKVAEESVSTPLEDGATSPILSLDMISIEQQPVSPATQYTRINQYLAQQMSEATVESFPVGVTVSDHSPADDVTDTTLQNLDTGYDEVDSPPFDRLTHPDQAVIDGGSGGSLLPLRSEDGAVSGGFEPDETYHDELEETEGACGGVDPNDGRRPDRSKLTLDLTVTDQDHQHEVMYVEAVHTLQQELEEELSSFESEFEEALLSMHSDHSWPSHAAGLTQSRSFSPETAEAARILARIGDEVQQRHFDHLERAVGRFMLANCAGLFTYENFREAALMALDKDVNGWKQVATLLLYSQHVALHMAQSGRRGLHRIINYTVKLLADTAAEFIIREGGWAGIASLDHSSTSSSPECLTMTQDPFLAAPSTSDRRRSSAPDLTAILQSYATIGAQGSAIDSDIPQPTTPNDTLDSMDGTILAESPNSVVSGGGGDTTTATSLSPDVLDSPGEGEGAGGGEGMVSPVGDGVMSSSLLAKAAVSVGVLAVGAAIALSLTRG